jgi:hypothetical protein
MIRARKQCSKLIYLLPILIGIVQLAAAAFLRHFTKMHDYAHLDIAGKSGCTVSRLLVALTTPSHTDRARDC